EFLYRDESVAVVDSANPLVGSSVDLPTFLAMEHVAVRIGTAQTRQHEAWLLGGRELKRRIAVTVSRFNALPQFIVGSHRIGMTHRRHAEWWSRHFPLRIVTLPFEVTPIGVHMQWNRNFDQDPAHAWLRDKIRGAIAG
ncbi:MAG TPA: LysR substrate-binding domain-containing protein, partial [Novosphingobium sp.]|nr:LysR substrate-binding domain-containing protein [Novosphingobium sp.]